MGRRPRQKQSNNIIPGNNNTKNSFDDDEYEEKLLDILEQLLECSGIWSSTFNSDNNNTTDLWETLSSSLLDFVEYLKQIMKASKQATATLNSPASSSWNHNYNTDKGGIHSIPLESLLEMEDLISKIRIQSNQLLSDNQNLSKELGLCHELEILLSTTTTSFTSSTQNQQQQQNQQQPQTLFLFSPLPSALRESFKRRRWQIQEAIQIIQDSISMAYHCNTNDTENNNNNSNNDDDDDNYTIDDIDYEEMIHRLANLSILIRRRFFNLKEYPWKDIMQLIKQLAGDTDGDNNNHSLAMQYSGLNLFPSGISTRETFLITAGGTETELSSTTTSHHDHDKVLPNPSISELFTKEFTSPSSHYDLVLPIWEVIRNFVLNDGSRHHQNKNNSTAASTLLIVGPEGSGKTYYCNQISRLLLEETSQVKVIRPSLPFDILGLTVGAAEDKLISMFHYVYYKVAMIEDTKCVLILDNIENIIGNNYEGPTKSIISSTSGGGSSGSSNNSGGGGGGSSNGEPHLISRLRSLFLSLLDHLQINNNNNATGNKNKEDDDVDEDDVGKRRKNVLVICTAKSNFGRFTDRFDVIHHLGLPDPMQRRQVILQYAETTPSFHSSNENDDNSCFSIKDSSESVSTMMEEMLSNLVECTSGCSFAELSQICSKAIQAAHIEDMQNNNKNNQDNNDSQKRKMLFLESLKDQLQLSVPESLRTGIHADFVDMTVFSARDLLGLVSDQYTSGTTTTTATTKTTTQPKLPLFGNSAQAAWEELRRAIVVPVCQAKALNDLLYGADSSRVGMGGLGGKTLAGGVLLTGPPGSGKTALAFHCATVAACINPSIKLINVSCTSLIHKEVGSSERSIYRLFQIAKSAAPCIVLMDGIENIATVRGNDNTTEGTMDRVLSTLLVSLDGIDSNSTTTTSAEPATMAIIGITHNVNWIDPALKRPGRLDRILELGLPEREARKHIILKQLQETEYNGDATNFSTLELLADHVAEKTNGLTGAEIISICDGAKMLASKDWFKMGMTTTTTQTTMIIPALRPEHLLAAVKLRNPS